MKIKIFYLMLTFLCIISYHNSYAHGIGGGRSYTFDKNDNSADHDAEKKAAKKKQDQDNWDDFMNAIKHNKKEPGPETNLNDSQSVR